MHGIDRRGPPAGHVAGRESRGGEYGHDSGERPGIARLDPEQEWRHEPCGEKRRRGADDDT